MGEIIVPVALCVVLPVMIVWLINRTRQNETNRKTEIMLKAIESGASIDADFFKALQDQKATQTIKERLLKRLCGGCICTLIGLILETLGILNFVGWNGTTTSLALLIGGILLGIGVSLIVVFFVGKKMLAKEMEEEAKAPEQK